MFKLIQGIIQKREEDKKIEIHVLKNTENKNMIKLFETKATICKLIILYQHSQMEHQRNGRFDVSNNRIIVSCLRSWQLQKTVKRLKCTCIFWEYGNMGI